VLLRGRIERDDERHVRKLSQSHSVLQGQVAAAGDMAAYCGRWRLSYRPLPDGSILKVQLDVPYEQMVWLQDEEWDELRYLQNKLRPGDVFIDVGANIGLWTLVAATSVGPSGRVFSFEPNPNYVSQAVGKHKAQWKGIACGSIFEGRFRGRARCVIFVRSTTQSFRHFFSGSDGPARRRSRRWLWIVC